MYSTYESLKKMLDEICDDDKKVMFGKTYTSAILINLEEAKEKLEVYENYDVPVYLGDIIEYNGEEYVVTCIYTDNSVDILGKDAQKHNVGLYKKNVKRVGRLEVIEED